VSERETPDHNTGKRRGRISLASSSEAPEEHEVRSDLVFFDILDASMSKKDISDTADRIISDELTFGNFQDIPPEHYPHAIAHIVLSELHVQPDLDAMRTTAEDGSQPSEEEKFQMQRALEIEGLFRDSTKALEDAAAARRTHEVVEELERHMDTNDRYDTNVLRLCMELHGRDNLGRFSTPQIVSTRILKMMIYLHDNETKRD